jgi:hypothetical protein
LNDKIIELSVEEIQLVAGSVTIDTPADSPGPSTQGFEIPQIDNNPP